MRGDGRFSQRWSHIIYIYIYNVCMYVCMHTYIYIYIYIYKYICIILKPADYITIYETTILTNVVVIGKKR